MSDTQIVIGAGSPVGAPTARVDGRAKVTGAARYGAEHSPDGVVHAVLVQSTVPAGWITGIDTTRALRMPGVLAVLTHENADRLTPIGRFPSGCGAQGLTPLQDDRIRFTGQPVGVVVAETLEQATDAARRVQVAYKTAPFVVDDADPDARAVTIDDSGDPLTAAWAEPYSRGAPDEALAAAPVTVEAVYTSPRQYHIAMEPHATVASWGPDGMLTVWEPTQWAVGARTAFAEWFDLPVDNVRVISPYIGGGFGSKGGVQPHAALAAAAAREVGRPVKLVLTRPQAFTGTTPRPAVRQHIALGADADGRLRALVHDGINETSVYDDYIEPVTEVSRYVYDVDNVRTSHRVVPVNAVTPGWMRAPGEALGTFALESAMDELADAVGLDPLELRLRNYAELDQDSGKPWSTRALREAYTEGARAFGWHRRDPRPRSMRAGRHLVGWGMATGTYPRAWMPAEARVRVRADGTVDVETSGVDIGTGTYTVLAQVAADALGVPVEQVTVRLGDSTYPMAPVAGGSMLTGALAPVVHAAATALRDQLDRLAGSARGMPFADILRNAGRDAMESIVDSMPPGTSEHERRRGLGSLARFEGPAAGSHSVHSWSAIFAEVRVDEDLGTVQVARLVGAFDCGRVLNPTTARSQLMGGMIMGVGAACFEGARVDRRNAAIVNANLADYLIPVNADVPSVEVLFVGEPDPHANPLGTKPVGELGITGTIAAIANAVHHATGRRIRDLPIQLEKLL
jgi:xanthine dehydrogenase YagR molybdenum-binding subunit